MNLIPILLENKSSSLEELQGSLILRDGILFTNYQLNNIGKHEKQKGDKAYEIYLVHPTAKIRSNDYYFNGIELQRVEDIESQLPYHNCYKVICASIDRIGHDYRNDVPNGDDYNYIVPELSTEAIESLVKYYNSYGNLSIEVKVKEYFDSWDDSYYEVNPIDLNKEGTVDITLPEILFKNKEGYNHLEWIYNRLINIHGENPNYDYMLKLKSIFQGE